MSSGFWAQRGLGWGLVWVWCLTIFGAGVVWAQDIETPAASAIDQQTIERALSALETFGPLLDARTDLQNQMDALAPLIEAASDLEKPALEDDFAALQAELDTVEEQISIIITGVSEADFGREDTEFDPKAEFTNLVEPFLSLLISATDGARRIERTRRDLAVSLTRLEDSDIALKNIDAAISQTKDPVLRDELEKRREVWNGRAEQAQTQYEALTQQLKDMKSNSQSAGTRVQTAMLGFFKDRGLSLVQGLGAFLGVLVLCRLIGNRLDRYLTRKGRDRSFTVRLSQMMFSIFSIVVSFAALLIIFNMRDDWLLLGLSTLFLVALIWVGIKMLPSLIEQMTVLLNMGAVQENERVLFNGVPYRVDRLGIYTDLVNPDLDGGTFTLPVRELIGLHSRPAAQNEAWFPSRKGDWVRLGDGNAGQVVAQTPEMVVVALLGGAQVTYQTGDYLAQTPENLSHGYRVEIEFGIGYQHQPQAADEILTVMQAEVERRMTGFVGPGMLRAVQVEFLRAGASSLDYEVEVDVTGAAAHRFEEIERELARVLVLIATQQGWEIPFQQIVMHRA